MNSNNTLEIGNDYPESPEVNPPASVDDFIRELEEKERDLHITAELEIEVSESEIDDSNFPDFIVEELKASNAPKIKARPEPEPAEKQTSSAAAEKLRREVAQLEGVVNKFKAERQELLDYSKRQTKDFENFKNRTERERNERLSVQMENLAVKMLPVLDNLNLALDFAMAMSPDKRAEIEPFVDGIALVHRQVDDVLTTMGLMPIVAVGNEFDPRLHEAVAIEPKRGVPPNTVSEELRRGYRMGNRVIRHSMVKVTEPVPEEKPSIEEPSAEQS